LNSRTCLRCVWALRTLQPPVPAAYRRRLRSARAPFGRVSVCARTADAPSHSRETQMLLPQFAPARPHATAALRPSATAPLRRGSAARGALPARRAGALCAPRRLAVAASSASAVPPATATATASALAAQPSSAPVANAPGLARAWAALATQRTPGSVLRPWVDFLTPQARLWGHLPPRSPTRRQKVLRSVTCSSRRPSAPPLARPSRRPAACCRPCVRWAWRRRPRCGCARRRAVRRTCQRARARTLRFAAL
jgi:hypothetical protein